jgi:alginate O-acetyltransferase complex protein AlgI
MLFNSLTFICFFWPVVACVFFLLGRLSHHLAGLWLCAASLFFYGWWNANYVTLLLVSVLFNYGAGYLIVRQSKQNEAIGQLSRGILIFAVVANLLLLSYYKYAQFFLTTFDHLLGANWSLGHIILPLGISFFTFTQIAFLVDTYRGKAQEYNFIHYLLFVTYFPHLIAGPILHHAQMMPQFALKQTYRLNWNNVAIGITFFTLGLAKKVLLADMFAGTASSIFQAATNGVAPMMVEAWIGALFYTLQLYFDFSGYTDMAIGISYIFNVKLPLNFNSPYKAANIIDFWKRWHMTLSAFLKDYLYIPLGGNRHGSLRRYINLMLTMLLGGLWHGAGWTFVIWGGLLGFYLVINHAFQAFCAKIGWEEGRFGRLGKSASVAVTFLSVVVAWVFFRSNNFATAESLLRGMAGLNGLSLTGSPATLSPALAQFLHAHGVVFLGLTPITLYSGPTLCKLAVGLMIIWLLPNSQQWVLAAAETRAKGWHQGVFTNWQPERTWTCLVIGSIIALSMLTLMSGPPSEFLYFQF